MAAEEELAAAVADEGSILVKVLASVLERIVQSNVAIQKSDPGQTTKFHALHHPPSIGIREYLERLHKYTSCSNECLVLFLIFIDRLIKRNNFLVTERTVHRVTLTAILLAAKFFDDEYADNAYYAKVGGVSVKELNGLEIEFLFRINFSLHTTPEDFYRYKTELLVAHSTNFGLAATSFDRLSPVVVHSHLPNIQEVKSGSIDSIKIPPPELSRSPNEQQHKAPQIPFISSAKENDYVINDASITVSPPQHAVPILPASSNGITSAIDSHSSNIVNFDHDLPNTSLVDPIVISTEERSSPPRITNRLISTTMLGNNNSDEALYHPIPQIPIISSQRQANSFHRDAVISKCYINQDSAKIPHNAPAMMTIAGLPVVDQKHCLEIRSFA